MRILYLGPRNIRFEQTLLASEGEPAVQREGPITLADVQAIAPDWIISFGYRHIVTPDIVGAYRQRILNLHLGALPWNRGADPIFWGVVENTGAGVTIHRMDEGLDTGPILVQQRVPIFEADTFQTLYDRATALLLELFGECWGDIREGQWGSFHRSGDKERYRALLEHGWQTPIAALRGIGRRI